MQTGPYGPFCMRGKLSPTPHKDVNEFFHRGISHTTSFRPQVVHRPPLAALGLVSAKGARRVFLGCGVGNGVLRCSKRDHRMETTPISRRLRGGSRSVQGTPGRYTTSNILTQKRL